MVNTSHYKYLLKRKDYLAATFLDISPQSFQKKQALHSSFVLLMHAELEEYFEKICASKAKKSLDKWLQNQKSSNILISILAHCDEKQDKKHCTKERVKHAVGAYLKKIHNNHGVKEKNIKTLLEPIGFDLDDLDPAWVSTISSFARNRGDIAHKSYKSYKATLLRDPRDTLRTLNLILSEISSIDRKIRALK